VVDSFKLQSHKTKHTVTHLRRILGRKCRNVLLVHEGNVDVNDNFRWATAHIAGVHRENVEGVNVYNLVKYHQLIITEAALAKLITEIHNYPKKRGWHAKFATPDGKPAPVPVKVEGWNKTWIEKKERLRNSEYRAREFFYDQQKWKWSSDLKGPLKIPKEDPLQGFRLKDFLATPQEPVWEKLESLYIDDEPVDEEPGDDEFTDLMDTMEANVQHGESQSTDLIDNKDDIHTRTLRSLVSGTGRRHMRTTEVKVRGKKD